MRVTSFHFDENGRLHLEKTPDTQHVIPCDSVIFSIGQRPELDFLANGAGVEQTPRRTVAIDPDTYATNRLGVFAAGDAVTGTAFVVEAIASGHKAASSIQRYLRGEPLVAEEKPTPPVVHLAQQEIAQQLTSGKTSLATRLPIPELPLEKRQGSFAEVELGYDDEQAKMEAERCLTCGICTECMSCVFACGRQAIVHDEVERQEEIKVGALILAPGYQVYNAQLSEEFGLGRYANVVTSLQYERLLSASGPTSGHVRRPSDGSSPRRIAFLQCVGSRDQSHDYCSSVCCMYAAKEAIMTIEHARAEARNGHGDGQVTCQVFFMDTRAYSKGYEEYYQRAEKKYGVKYTRCRLSEVKEDPETKNLIVRYSRPYEGKFEVVEEEFDLVVLSVGMEISPSVKALGEKLGLELDNYGFCHTTLFNPLESSRHGIYVAGPFREPKDIPETVIEASGAAASVAQLLSPSRYTLATKQEYPPERDVIGEEPRIGVFVCHCGSNIGGYLDVPGVAEYARSLPGVIHAEDNLYTCSQDTIAHIIEQVKEKKLNRVVVASCTPITHEPLFQDAIRQAGLNPYLFEMANIRNQCSWVHSSDWEGATKKAKSLVRMAVARAARLAPLKTSAMPVNKSALIIGAGPAGMTAALTLAEQGFPVHLIERASKIGGNLRQLHYFVQEREERYHWTDATDKQIPPSPREYLTETVGKVLTHPLIKVHLNTEIVETHGFKGNFTSVLKREDHTFKVQHGVTIVATGGVEYKGNEYGYGKDPRIMTQLEFEALLANIEEALKNRSHKGSVTPPKSVVMIQCVGPAERYCSRLCCTTSLKNALKLKDLNPDAEVTIIYRDIRTYGFKERLYTMARKAGVRFIHFEFDRKPEVLPPTSQGENAGPLTVRVWEPVLGRHLNLQPDVLVLSMPIVPPEDTQELASRLKIPVDMDGFFLEAHVKLRPVDFPTDGIFMAGTAHYPKFLDETIAQAKAAASRAAIVLAQETMLTNARVAVVDPAKCVGCLTCVRICPYEVPKVRNEYTGVGEIIGAAFIEPAICHGCGTCASECPARAIQLMHYTDAQILAKVDALFRTLSPQSEFIPLEQIASSS
jgi:heterodisulfide reductase subunit A-like polyferredoxin